MSEHWIDTALKTALQLVRGPAVPRAEKCPWCQTVLQSRSLICSNCGHDAAWEQWATFVQTLEPQSSWLQTWRRRQLTAIQRAYVDALLFLSGPAGSDAVEAIVEGDPEASPEGVPPFSLARLIRLFAGSKNPVPSQKAAPAYDTPVSKIVQLGTSFHGPEAYWPSPHARRFKPKARNGSRIDSRSILCPSCGVRNRPGTSMCSHCHEPLTGESAASSEIHWRESIRKSEIKRKEIFKKLTEALDQAKREAMAEFPSDPSVSGTWQDNVFQQIEHENSLRDRYEQQVAEECGITVDELSRIAQEGAQKSWGEP